MSVAAEGTVTPYSTALKFFTDEPVYVPELDRERLAAYDVYERIYWSSPHTFRITMRGTNDQPIYVPNSRSIVNETAHYLLKGLQISTMRQAEGGRQKTPFELALASFMKRERFLSKFVTAKLSGVTRGDWILHLTANPNKPQGKRISVNSVDPAAYFPEYDDDDLDRVIAVNLVEQIMGDDGKYYMKRLRYWYEGEEDPEAEDRQVWRMEQVLELEGWWDGKAARVKQTMLTAEPLPDEITTIPVYHFKNIDWQGDPFGRSELAGFEMLQNSINQSVSDEELALALMGLGVYGTDAPPPTDDDGNEVPWEIAPGKVIEMPAGATLNKVQGITSVQPMQDHLEFLINSLYEGSSTFRTPSIDVAVAESGVALAIRFSPTLAKLEQRDLDGVDKLENFWYDWKFWWKAYEGEDFTAEEIAITLGEKLPINPTQILNELNNMLDRQVITRAYYREQMRLKLGYEFPEGMEEAILEEQRKLTEVRMFESPVNGENPALGNGANNSSRPNESSGTEATNGAGA